MFKETFSEAWNRRYGSSPEYEIPSLARFLTHRSIRQFSAEPVTEEVVACLIAAGQSAATSSNLQLYSILTVQDPKKREKMAGLCGGQAQVRQAPWFFAFLIDHHRLRTARTQNVVKECDIDYEEFLIMAAVDAALAAERMLCAAQAMGLGDCYIGALRNDPQGVKELLKLPPGVFGVFGMTMGYPAPAIQSSIKPRLAQKSIWFHDEYPATHDLSEYDRRMAGFYAEEVYGDRKSWSCRSAERVTKAQMSGRHILKDWLASQQLGLR